MKAFKGLNCFYTNADSLPNKLYELKGRVQEATDGFDIIGITEVYLKKCRFLPGKAELQLEGFDLFQSEGDEHKRGVAVYINEQLKAEELKIIILVTVTQSVTNVPQTNNTSTSGMNEE